MASDGHAWDFDHSFDFRGLSVNQTDSLSLNIYRVILPGRYGGRRESCSSLESPEYFGQYRAEQSCITVNMCFADGSISTLNRTEMRTHTKYFVTMEDLRLDQDQPLPYFVSGAVLNGSVTLLVGCRPFDSVHRMRLELPRTSALVLVVIISALSANVESLTAWVWGQGKYGNSYMLWHVDGGSATFMLL
ncbi:hypothetical protein TEQG_01323 [Trichophyton equinum CBS 127.97]|uniref:Uncharacterized protein n=1 Tax=Trichophyton equinum (strain ATCC MYA-4606 / CBS 127.97) TaxID=559882 RepID=F2PK66_TRIEC|nr:hypothetical protein TEQG_01323 [Trichophyton equinum CBS 127.97]